MGAREEQQDRFVARAVGLDPGRVLADARNAAHDYVADGIDAVETVLRHELDWRVEAKARALEGLERVHERLQDALRAALAAFERHARASAFAVPPAVLRGAHGPDPAPGDPGAPSGSSAGHDEVELDEELEGLRKELARSKGRCRGMRRELDELEGELAECGDVAALEATVTQNRQHLAEDTKRLAQAALHLQDLLPRLERLEVGPTQSLGAGGAHALQPLPANVRVGEKTAEKGTRKQQQGVGDVSTNALKSLRAKLKALR